MSDDGFGARGYKEGSITRVKMKNFLTYEDCEVRPGPKLNVVIGPNGTGKSALTHAICLACCGQTKDVGRSNDLTNYVMKGKEGHESFVEVDILGSDGNVITLRRSINSDNRGSKWTLNGRQEKQAAVKVLMKNMHIDLDNLCSFMPQERVGSFSTLSPADILGTTLQSLGGTLADEQQQLSEIEKNKEDNRRNRDAKVAQLNHFQQQKDNMRTELDRLQSRDDALKYIEYCKAQKLFLESSRLRNEFTESQVALEEANSHLAVENERLGPLETAVRELNKKQARRNKLADSVSTKQRHLEQSLRKKREAVDECELELRDVSAALESLDREQRRGEVEVHETQQRLQQEEGECRTAEALLPRLRQKKEANRVELKSLTDSKQALEEVVTQRKAECRDLGTRVNQLMHEYRGLQDTRQIYRTRLVRLSERNERCRDTVTAMDWLAEKESTLREQGHLRGGVHGPVAMLCDVKDPTCAAMLEKIIPENKLLAFVVESKQDASFLIKELRHTMGLKVDVYTMMNQSMDDPPYSVDMLSGDDFRGLNLQYLSSQITCPDIIRSFLCSFHGLHQVVWGRCANHVISDHHKNTLCPPGVNNFRLFIHDTAKSNAASSSAPRHSNSQSRGRPAGQLPPDITLYNGRKSNFDPNSPPTISSILVRPGRYVGSSGDANEDVAARRSQLETESNNVQQQLKTLNAEVQDKMDQIRNFNSKKAQLVSVRDEILKGLQLPANKKKNVDMLTKKLVTIRQRLAAGLERDRAERLQQYQHVMGRSFETIGQVDSAAAALNEHAADSAVANALRDELMQEISAAEEQLENARRSLDDFKQRVLDAEKRRSDVNRKRKQVESDMASLMTSSGLTKTQYTEQIYPKVKEYCATLLEEVHVEERIAELTAIVESIVDNPQLQTRFEQLSAQVIQLQREVDAANTGYSTAEDALRDRFRTWREDVQAIVEKLNVRFGEYMQKLQLGGEIVLVEKGGISEYEINIRVKFREEAALESLNGSRHSGGERAVSTVMYLMALQDMTRSPFRVVDEINQGMDEINERRVFDRIVQECCGPQSTSQYFLITPKLLHALTALENDDITVLLVWNGPGVDDKWDFSELVETVLSQRGSANTAAAATAEDHIVPARMAAGRSGKRGAAAVAGAAGATSMGMDTVDGISHGKRLRAL